MHRMRHTIDEIRPWTVGPRSIERHPHGADHDTRELLRHGLRARITVAPTGGSHPPPSVRARRPVVRSWRSTRVGARAELAAREASAARSGTAEDATLRRHDHAAGLVGMALGTAIGLALLRCAGPWAFRADWMVATVPLLTLWASVGGLVAISIVRARRGEEPLPELTARGPLGERRSLARPVAIGAILGVVLVAALRVGIAVSSWLPAVPT